MQKAFITFIFVALVAQARIISSPSGPAYQNPTLSNGSPTPPGAGAESANNPPQSWLPTPGASDNANEAANRLKFQEFKKQFGKFYTSSS